MRCLSQGTPLSVAAAVLFSMTWPCPGQVVGENLSRPGEPGRAARRAVVNFAELAEQERLSPPAPKQARPGRPTARKLVRQPVPERALRTPPERPAVRRPSAHTAPTAPSGAEAMLAPAAPPLSPLMVTNFQGLLDDLTPGTYNPDGAGAVGPNHLLVAANTQVRAQTRGGAERWTVSLDGFWARIGASNVYDPRVVYDPYGQRWIMSAQADAFGPNPLLLVGVSQTSDLTTNWFLYAVDLDATAPRYAESPNLGFSRDWIVVQADLFNGTNNAFEGSAIHAFNKANLYAGGAGLRTSWLLTNDVAAHVPAMTYDGTLGTNYLMAVYNSNWTNGVGYLAIYTISGPLGAEVLDGPTAFPRSDGWADFPPEANFLPQLGSTNKIAAPDARLANVVYRDGSLWTTHTAYFPADNPVWTAVQWWEVSPGIGTVVQMDQLVDRGTNVHYAYPSIAVNRNSQAILGYSVFYRLYYPLAAYSYHGAQFGGFLQGVAIKAGDAPYYKPDLFTNNAWGDWSASAVDPVNDTDLWALQQYAALPSGTNSRWGLWWGKITPYVDLAVTVTPSVDTVPAGVNLTYTVGVTNKNFGLVAGVKITNTLPAGAVFVSATPSQGSCVHAAGQVVCDLLSLGDNAGASVAIVANLTTLGANTNVATVSALADDEATADNVAVAVVTNTPAADLSVAVADAPDPVAVGSNLTYTVWITNRGPSAATDVRLTNRMPAGVVYVSAVPSVGTCGQSGSNVICSLGTLLGGAVPTVTIVVRPSVAGSLTNRASVGGTVLDPVLANNVATNLTRANALPTISTIASRTIAEDTSTGPISFTVGDLETPAANLVLSGFSSAPGIVANEGIVFGGSGSSRTVTVTPLPDAYGAAIITIAVTDADGGTRATNFTLTITAVNDPPTLNPLPNLMVNEDPGPQQVLLTGISPGAANENQTLVVSATSSSTGIIPTPVISYTNGLTTGVLTFTPAANAFTTVTPVTITVTVSDGLATTNRAFTVTINPVNDPPTLTQPADLTISEDAPQQTVTLAGITSGAANESQTLTVTASNRNPALLTGLSVVYTSPNTTGTLRFTPVADASGSAVITVTVDDGGGSNNIVSRSFTVTVLPVNDVPTLDAIASLTIPEDAGFQTVNLTGISAGAPDETNQTLNVLVTNVNTLLLANFAVNYTSPNPTGTLTFATATNAYGTNTITVRVNDGGASNNLVTQTFTVSVYSVNDPPTLDPIETVTVLEDSGQQVVTLTGISPGPANESAQPVTLSATSADLALFPNPTVSYTNGQTVGFLRFTPALNASGTNLVTVTANDAQGSNNVTVRAFMVVILPVNDPPAISAVPDVSIPEDTITNLTFTVSDVESPAAALTLVAASTNQTLLPVANIVLSGTGASRTATLAPAADQFGTTLITLTVSDPEGLNASTSFLLTVRPVNDPPTIEPIPDLVIIEGAGTQAVPLTGLSGGPPNEPQTLSITATSSDTVIVPTPTVTYAGGSTATLRFTPPPKAWGEVVLTVRVNDGGASNNVTLMPFRVIITPVNDPPVISAITPFIEILEDAQTPSLPFTIGDEETPAANLILAVQSSNEELVTPDGIILGGSGSNRTVVVRPLPDQSGSAFITITVRDPEGLEASTFFEVSVLPVNDPPVISPLANQVIPPGASAGPLAFTVGDAESSAATLIVAATSLNPTLLPASGVVLGGGGANRTLTLTPFPNQLGSATVRITAGDGEITTTNTFVLTVNALPTLSTLAHQTMVEDTVLGPLNFTVGDVETPAGDLTVLRASSNPALVPESGIVLGGGGANRTVTVRPSTNQFGVTRISLTVVDGLGFSNSTLFELVVSAVNDLPTVSALGSQTTPENTPVNVPFTVGDVETPAGQLVVSASASNPSVVPQSGLALGGSGASRLLTLTPAPGAAGVSTITLWVADADGGLTTTTFPLTVTGLNEPPTISSLPNLTLPEDTASGPLPMSVGDPETPPGNLTLSGSSAPAALISNFVFGGSGAARTVTLVPGTNQFGTGTITLTVSDGTNQTSTSFQMTFAAVNDPPTLNAISDLVVNQGAGLQTVNLSGITAGPNESGQTLSITAVSGNPSVIPHPSVNYASPASTGTLTFTPVAGASGTAVITVTVNDNQPQNNTLVRTFTVTVTPAVQPPTIGAVASQVTGEEVPLSVPFVIGDPDTPALSLVVTPTSSSQTLVPNANLSIHGSGSNRTVLIVPASNQTGTATITLTVSDGALTATTGFQLTVNAVNDLPTLNPLADLNAIATNANYTLTVLLAGITSGATNESQTLSVTVAGNSNPSLFRSTPSVVYTSPNTNGSLVLSPTRNGTGTSTLTVRVNDNGSSNNVIDRSFVLNIRDTGNALPGVSTIANQTTPEDTPTAAIAFTVSDATTPASLITVTGRSSNPSLLPDANIVLAGTTGNRTVTLRPATNQFGTATVTLSVTDTNFGSTNRSFTLTVTPVNDAPVISSMTNVTLLRNTPSAPLPVNVGDAETPAGNLTVTATSGNTTLVPNANLRLGGSGTNRALVVTPATNQSGSATITVAVSDGTNTANTAFTVTVTSLNDAPTISSIADQVTGAGTPTPAIPFTVSDPETPAGSLTLRAASSNTGLLPTNNVVFGGSGSNRTVTLAPVGEQTGEANVTLTVSDGTNNTATTFKLTVTPVNRPPTLAALGDVAITRAGGVNQAVVNLSGIGPGAPEETQTLIVAASSSNPALVPNPAVSYTSPSSSGTLIVTALGSGGGSALITVTLSDGQPVNSTVTRSFTVTVNGAPAFGELAPRTVLEDALAAVLPFTVTDVETPPGSLTVTAVSRTTALIPQANVVLGGAGSNRTVSVTPLPDLSGSAVLDLTVTDGAGLSATGSLQVIVASVNDAPTLNSISDVVTNQDAGPQNVSLSGIGSGAANENQVLTVTALSANPTLIPHPDVAYTSPAGAGTLTFRPNAGASGSVVITVTARDDGTTLNGGVDAVSRSFTVTLRPTNVEQPTDLRIVNLGNGFVEISWPGNYTGFTLESRPQVAGGTGWANASALPSLVAGRYRVVERISGGSMFYRLASGSPLPRLAIAPGAGNTVVLSWPDAFPGYTLESRDTVGTPGGWTVVGTPPVLAGGQYTVTVPAGGASRFYRLRQ